MEIQVEYVAQVKKAAGVGSHCVSLDGAARLKDLLECLPAYHGEEFRSLVFDEHGVIRPSIMVTINDSQVWPGDPTLLNAGDCIALLSPMSGG